MLVTGSHLWFSIGISYYYMIVDTDLETRFMLDISVCLYLQLCCKFFNYIGVSAVGDGEWFVDGVAVSQSWKKEKRIIERTQNTLLLPHKQYLFSFFSSHPLPPQKEAYDIPKHALSSPQFLIDFWHTLRISSLDKHLGVSKTYVFSNILITFGLFSDHCKDFIKPKSNIQVPCLTDYCLNWSLYGLFMVSKKTKYLSSLLKSDFLIQLWSIKAHKKPNYSALRP